MNPVVTCLCREPNNNVIRSVYPLILTPENLNKLWVKCKGLRTVFEKEINDDFHKFVSLFLAGHDNIQARGLMWVIDDFVGVYYIDNIVPGLDANAHYIFFDRRHTGREELTKQMLNYLFQEYQFHRLSINLAYYATHASKHFVQQLGFKVEGRRRSSIKFNGVWFDVGLYGLLNPSFEDTTVRLAETKGQ